jgi:hypothetical protein
LGEKENAIGNKVSKRGVHLGNIILANCLEIGSTNDTQEIMRRKIFGLILVG